MKVAVVYQSKSGNIRILAEELYDSLQGVEKEIIDIDETDYIPDADFYFIGFGIRNNSCGMDIAELFENMQDIRYALFLNCGFLPTERYKEKLLNNMDVWLPEGSELVDTFLCQGRMEKHEQDIMISKIPQSEMQLRDMFAEGSTHPDEEDLSSLRFFVSEILDSIM